jgi:3,4-dihydroxy-2-butanone 4-phosphate synthase
MNEHISIVVFCAFIVDSGVRERETDVVIFVEAVALQSIDNNRCLK